MTKSVTRRAVLAGWLGVRSFSQDAPTNFKSLHHKPRASTEFGAGLFIFRNANAQSIAETKTLDKPPWLDPSIATPVGALRL
jgi:hypothetical protein